MEFYYTYKKHVKIGRNGTLLFGETEPPESRVAEEEAEQKVSGDKGRGRGEGGFARRWRRETSNVCKASIRACLA